MIYYKYSAYKFNSFCLLTIGKWGCIESGRLLFPAESRNLNWWYEFKKELLGFPGTKYKDQVDALSQAIKYVLDEESQ